MNPTLALDPILLAALSATLTPLAACGLIVLATRSRPALSAGLSIAAVAAALAGSLVLLTRVWTLEGTVVYTTRWMAAGHLEIAAGFLLDPLSVLMLTVVTLICLLVQVYSLGYMAGDPGFARYYAWMSLFAWAMTSLTLSPNLLQLYVFWELVGVSSYLLIGFWYQKFSASQAGKKAFVMTRLGDVAFFLGLLLVLTQLGHLDITRLNAGAAPRLPAPVATAAALLIFGGIVGKSAQFPLLTWLPDAMEGPTPVSALLHSATMVAAGVFLLARLLPFFQTAPAALTVILAVGTLSMLLASTMALVSRDIKQVWAYSTISQLGFMIMGLAAGGYAAGVFHLTTHAGFKALLFLASGVLIHHHGTNDIFALARRGARGQTLAVGALALAAAALAGLPPLSGFFSKELILAALAAQANPIWLAAGLAGAFLTAYYAFRLIFVLLTPENGAPADRGDGHHAAASSPAAEGAMAAPLALLAALTLLLGAAEKPLARFLTAGGLLPPAPEAPHGWLPAAAVALCGAGLALAWWEFGRRGAPRIGFAERSRPVAQLFAERWYLDRLLRRLVGTLVDRGAAHLCAQGDRRVIDPTVDGLAAGTVAAGRQAAGWHRGAIQSRLLAVFLALAALAVTIFF